MQFESDERCPHLVTKIYIQLESSIYDKIVCMITNKITNRLIKNFTITNKVKNIIQIKEKSEEQGQQNKQKQPYKFEVVQNIRISLYRIKNVNFEEYQEIGILQFPQQDIAKAINSTYKNHGYFCINRDDIKYCNFFIQFFDQVIVDERDRALRAAYCPPSQKCGNPSNKQKGSIKYSKITKPYYENLVKEVVSAYLLEKQQQRQKILQMQLKKQSQRLVSFKHTEEANGTSKRIKSIGNILSAKCIREGPSMKSIKSLKRIETRSFNNQSNHEETMKPILKQDRIFQNLDFKQQMINLKDNKTRESCKKVDGQGCLRGGISQSEQCKKSCLRMKSNNHIKWKESNTAQVQIEMQKQNGSKQQKSQKDEKLMDKKMTSSLSNSKMITPKKEKQRQKRNFTVNRKFLNLSKAKRVDKENQETTKIMNNLKCYFASFEERQRNKIDQLIVASKHINKQMRNYQLTKFVIWPQTKSSNTSLHLPQQEKNKNKMRQQDLRKTEVMNSERPGIQKQWLPVGVKMKKSKDSSKWKTVRVSNNPITNINQINID